MKKITKKEAFMGVLVGGLLVVFLVYLMVFSKFNEKTDALKSKNNSLRAEVESIRGYYENKAIYEKDKAEMEVKIQDMIKEYPADAREEDAIMMAVDMQEKSEIGYKSISLPPPEEPLYVVEQDIVAGAEIEGLDAQLDFMGRDVTYDCTLDYGSLKSCIETIYKNPNRIAIQEVTLIKEEKVDNDQFSSNLRGNIIVSFYSMQGTGKEYVAPDMSAYIAGTDNPFKLVRLNEEE